MPIIAVATKTTYATIVTYTKYPTKANFYQFSNFVNSPLLSGLTCQDRRKLRNLKL